MWPDTALTRGLGVSLPILQAPMAGGATTAQLVAAVSNAGGLGSLGAGYTAPGAIRSAVKEIRALTGRPFAVNLFVGDAPADTAPRSPALEEAMSGYRLELGIAPPAEPGRSPDLDEQLAVLVEERVPVVSFTFGVLSESWMKRLHDAGIVIMGTATTVQEAALLAEAGADMIVAQGAEAGGHRGTFRAPFERAMVGLIALIPQIVDRVSVPVVAAGAIMDGRGIVAALALGAAGVQMGTAFLPCPESGASPAHKAAVLAATDDSTVLTRVFSGKPARGIENRFIVEMRRHEASIPPYPVQHLLTSDIRRAAGLEGRAELMSLWAGQGAGMSTSLPAGELIARLDEEVRSVLGRLRT